MDYTRKMKKVSKLTALLLVLVMAASLTACNRNKVETNQKNDEDQSMDLETKSPNNQESEPQDSQEPEVSPDVAATPEEPEEFVPVAGLSEDYADLDKRCFAYDGKIYTLGESTLQDMIDGGVPFDETELNNKDNNINNNYETSRYSITLNQYTNMQFSFLNTTGKNQTEKDCVLSLVRWYSIYVPHEGSDAYESLNEDIKACISDAAKHVCFSFPLTLTKEQLLENNSAVVAETDGMNKVTLMVDSEEYMAESGYSFKFDKDTNQLEDVTITWVP